MAEKKTADAGQRIVDGPPRQAGIRWPENVDAVLVDLVRRADDAGAKTSRKEMAAALVLQARSMSPQAARDAVLVYRQTTVGEVFDHDGSARRGRDD